MTTRETTELVASALVGLVLVPVLAALFRALTIRVEDETAVLVTRFGKLVSVLKRPGLHVYPSRVLPWVQVRSVSLQRDFRHFMNIHVNDARGTTLVADLWLEFRVVDPQRAVFAVDDWNKALKNVVQHAAIAILGSRQFQDILTDHSEIGEMMRREIEPETERWGVKIDNVFLRDLSLLPEVSQRLFETVAARLELAKAHIEEEGRQRIALLEARTAAEVASLVAEAKGQYPAAVGRAFAKLAAKPEVLAGYNELYELSVLRPHRTVVFQGFEPGEVRAMDAAMAAPPPGDQGIAPFLPPVGGTSDTRLGTRVEGGAPPRRTRSDGTTE
jgi:regulator of protease activity HflC (stomatin/prohibitin superfamily)